MFKFIESLFVRRCGSFAGSRAAPHYLASAMILGAISACSPFAAVTPSGFVALKDHGPDYVYRATTADGLVLSVRMEDNDSRGTMAFWERAVENQLRNRGGYALLERKDVKSGDGTPGRQLRFGHDEGRTPHLYYISVFVSEQSAFLHRKHRVFVLEAGGTRELMIQNAAVIDAYVSGFSIHRAKPKTPAR